MWKLFIREIGNYAFLHCFKKVMDELLLDIELQFTKIKNVKSRSGSPQGLRSSCQQYIIVKDQVIKKVLAQVDILKIFIIVQSDDILIGATCEKELQKTITLLEKQLLMFDLHIDHSKTQFVRSSLNLSDKAYINWNEADKCWEHFDLLKRMKWLGFYLYDGDLFNVQLHTRDRFISSGKKELVTLK